MEKKQPKLPPDEMEYLHKSLERRDLEIQEQLTTERRLREAAEATARAEAEKAEQERARALAEIEKSLEAEAERAKEAEAKAKAEVEKAKAEKQRTQVAVGAGFLLAILLALLGFLRVQQANKEARTAKLNEVNGLIMLAKTDFHNHKQLESLMASVKALNKLHEIEYQDANAFKELKILLVKFESPIA